MSFMDEINKIPPVTRFLCASTLAVSLPVMLQLLSPYRIVFVKDLVFQKFEIWRLFTSMFFPGTGISFIFDFAMLYRNSNSLETSYYAGHSADYAWQLLINACGIVALNVPFATFLHFRPLLLSLITVSSRLSPNSVVSIFGLFTLQNSYFPYAMLVMDLLMGGPKAAGSALTGLISGYAWWYLVHNTEAGRPGAAYATAPAWMRSLFGHGVTERATAGVAAAGGAANRTFAQATGYNWGSGRRLGN